eukprot:GHVO01051584.1.p1 GENE.GHVO01051584.1~~GHVO01051584.1.p1  ORF type:complete len:312 (+),score=66.94 GHVO01051584.1:31-966(+)
MLTSILSTPPLKTLRHTTLFRSAYRSLSTTADWDVDQLDWAFRRRRWKRRLFTGACLAGAAGVGVGEMRRRQLRMDDINRAISSGVSKLDKLMSQMSLSPSTTDPLLPDVKDLEYPPNLPTLVINLDRVVANIDYDKRLGWRIKKRPHADEFFKTLIFDYEIVLWSDEEYPTAQDVAQRWGLPVVGALHRSNCTEVDGVMVKDLKRLGRDMDKIVMVDCDKEAMRLNPDNGLIIRAYDGSPDDRELKTLIPFLRDAAHNKHGSVRDFLGHYNTMGGDATTMWEKEKLGNVDQVSPLVNVARTLFLKGPKNP